MKKLLGVCCVKRHRALGLVLMEIRLVLSGPFVLTMLGISADGLLIAVPKI
jgi:hypothetical protein